MPSIDIDPSGPRLRVLAIAGSLRRSSFNRALLQASVEAAPARVSIEIYGALGSIPLFSEDLETGDVSNDPEEVVALRSRVRAADALLIATPEYNQSIPGVLKNAIDWLSRERPDAVLAGKSVGIFGATTGRWGTRLAQAALRHTLYACEARILPTPSLFLPGAASLFDKNGVLVDQGARDSLRALIDALAAWSNGFRPAD